MQRAAMQNSVTAQPKEIHLAAHPSAVPCLSALLRLCSPSAPQTKEQPALHLGLRTASKDPGSAVCCQRLKASKIGRHEQSFEAQWAARVPLWCFPAMATGSGGDPGAAWPCTGSRTLRRGGT